MECRIAELLARIFGHALNVERENLQCAHHSGNAVGNHAEVFGACEHRRGVDDGRELPHGFAIPEVVVAMIEEIVVEAVERPAFVVVEVTVYVGELGGDARMVFAFFHRVFNEEYLIDQTLQGVA